MSDEANERDGGELAQREVQMRSMKRRRGTRGGMGDILDYRSEIDAALEWLVRDVEQEETAAAVIRLAIRQPVDGVGVGGGGGGGGGDRVQLFEKMQALGAKLTEVGNRLAREHATWQNGMTWPLTQDLTMKIFGMLDTVHVARVACTCTMLRRLAMEPSCWEEIDLTPCAAKATSHVVGQVVKRAGPCLRSLKVGVLPHCMKKVVEQRQTHKSPDVRAESEYYFDKSLPRYQIAPGRGKGQLCALSGLCLAPIEDAKKLNPAGHPLRVLHLYNVLALGIGPLRRALAACPLLQDLELVGLKVGISVVMECLSTNCHQLQELTYQPSKGTKWGPGVWTHQGIVKTSACLSLVKGCSEIHSLSLRGTTLSDRKADILVKGLSRLVHLDFSDSWDLTGSFLARSLLRGEKHICVLHSLVLRDCAHLNQIQVEQFLAALLSGDCKCLRHLDFSNAGGMTGLASAEWMSRQPSFQKLVDHLRAEHPILRISIDSHDISCSDLTHMTSSPVSDEGGNYDDYDNNDEEDLLHIFGSSDMSLATSEDDEDDDEDGEDDEEEDDEDEDDDDDEGGNDASGYANASNRLDHRNNPEDDDASGMEDQAGFLHVNLGRLCDEYDEEFDEDSDYTVSMESSSSSESGTASSSETEPWMVDDAGDDDDDTEGGATSLRDATDIMGRTQAWSRTQDHQYYAGPAAQLLLAVPESDISDNEDGPPNQRSNEGEGEDGS
ncbi:hypothetical protein CBR_g46206 [Chara braunii]|uniref:F-box domain-containing protein n=1 Tax=Chara braunii TaxID=69332 RepID=A0A388M012_CHABU|nr:hypothetical protein CBR_g46206 [Chara braunii]|eukprot:GBG87907.1 hypothetical protein CBR_g46206 [Chara braunii]